MYFNGKYFVVDFSGSPDGEYDIYESSNGIDYVWMRTVEAQAPSLNVLNGRVIIREGEDGCGSTLSYSEDGSNWTSVIVDCQSHDILYGNGIYFLCPMWTANPYGLGKYSTDLETWTDIDFSDRGENLSITCVFADGKFIMYYSNGYAETSTDAVNWTPTSYSGMSNVPYHIKYDNGIFVATLDNKVAYSTDGFAWNEVSVSGVNEVSELLSGGGEFVVVYNRYDQVLTYHLCAAHSKDGINWTTMSIYTGNPSYNACFTGDEFCVLWERHSLPNGFATYTPGS